jgi:hypothetical protein
MKLNEESKLDMIVQRMRADNSIDAPADAVKYAKNLYRTRSAEPKQTLVRRMLGVLRVDLAPGTVAFGERSATVGKARQMLYESGDIAVDLRIKPDGKDFEIHGQILGEGFENSDVQISNDLATGKTMTDKMSEFKLVGLPAGEYSLFFRNSDTEIVIDKITIS